MGVWCLINIRKCGNFGFGYHPGYQYPLLCQNEEKNGNKTINWYQYQMANYICLKIEIKDLWHIHTNNNTPAERNFISFKVNSCFLWVGHHIADLSPHVMRFHALLHLRCWWYSLPMGWYVSRVHWLVPRGHIHFWYVMSLNFNEDFLINIWYLVTKELTDKIWLLVHI